MSKCITDIYGNKRWYNDEGLFHREDGPCMEFPNGSKHWYLNGKLHRKGGPAIEFVDGCQWYEHGLCHREDGPALDYADGFKSWHYKGKYIDCKSQEEFLKIIKMKVFW